MTTTEEKPSALRAAIAEHLEPDLQDLVPACAKAVVFGQLAARGEPAFLDKLVAGPDGRLFTVQEWITECHLNSFIDWSEYE